MVNWKKWPNEKPYTSGWYLIAKSNNGVYEYASMYRMKYHKNDDTWGLCKDFEPEFWAEVNLPYYDQDPFIPFVSRNGG